jgi:hypothetical protein
MRAELLFKHLNFENQKEKKMKKRFLFVCLVSLLAIGFPIKTEASVKHIFEVQNYGKPDNLLKVKDFGSKSVFNRQLPINPLSQQNSVISQSRYWLKIRNESRWDIYRIYMSSAEVSGWGPDQLGDRVLRFGGTFTITNITPGEYDIMFVDEDNDKCVLRNVKMFENKDWTLTSDWLVKCQRNN